MDCLTFISNLADSLAWPLSILVLFFIVRKELPNIARSIKKVKYKDVELEFSEALESIAKEAKQSLPEIKSKEISGESTDDIEENLKSVAAVAPRAAILEAWVKVESAAIDVINNKSLGSNLRYPGPSRLLTILKNSEILNGRQIMIFEQLRVLRNEAVHVHNAQFTKAAVENYIESALLIASYLEDVANGL